MAALQEQWGLSGKARILLVLSFAFMLLLFICTGCVEDKLSIDSTDEGRVLHVSASTSNSTAVSSIVISRGENVEFDANIENGSMNVKLVNAKNVIAVEKEVSGKELVSLECAPDSYSVFVKTSDATGELDIKAKVTDGGDASGHGIVNPWVPQANAQEAALAAGLKDFSVPQSITVAGINFQEPSFTATDDIVEAMYKGGDGSVCIRKGAKTVENLSGDYNLYPAAWEWTVDGLSVIAKGYSEGAASNLSWSSNDANFSIVSFGLNGPMGFSEEEAAVLLAGVR